MPVHEIMDRTFSILTIGCKLNQYESECIRNALVARGWKCLPVDSKASFYIINSCTVTARSDSRCRNAVRRARRRSHESFVLVTGCYAEVDPDRISKMSEVDLVVCNTAKGSIPELLDAVAAGERPCMAKERIAKDAFPVEDLAAIDVFGCRSRAFVKIQDGCDSACSYCIVPRARGRSRSIPPERVIQQVNILCEANYSEIVLVGVHIGRYGMDLEKGISLADLIELLLDRTAVRRIRLSSIEPTEITDRLICLVRGNDRIASHFHIPLQSGDDEILKNMNRPYTVSLFAGILQKINSLIPEAAIGTDVIVGFPGETEESFERTVSLIESLPLSYLHVFSFSPRPLTSASQMRGVVSPAHKKSRSRILIELGKEKRRQFEISQIGKLHSAVIVGKRRAPADYSRALTGNYCEVFLSENLPERSMVELRITSEKRGRLYGILSSSSHSKDIGEFVG